MSKAKKKSKPQTPRELAAARLKAAREAADGGLPFVLQCHHCEEGDDLTSVDAAIAAGWIEVKADRFGLSWNFLGVCPVCQQEDEPTLRYEKTAAEAAKPGELFG